MAYLKRNRSSASIRLVPVGAPSSVAEGQVYFNSVTNVAYVYASGFWNQINAQFLGSGGVMSTYASGGTDYIVHTFRTSGAFEAVAGDVDYLVVAGGGAGGAHAGGGGGGAGGFRTGAALEVTAQSYTVTIGAGGVGNNLSADASINGLDSVFSSITSTGGGAGRYRQVGIAGGSGGGGGADGGAAATARAGGAGNSPSTDPSQGNNGGATTGAAYMSGGGGGASAVGAANSGQAAGHGGAGENNVMGLNDADSYALLNAASAGHDSGGARYFSGGGGAGRGHDAGTKGNGGVGGGSDGGDQNTVIQPLALPNTGGGGGGAGADIGVAAGISGNGASGIVMIRYIVFN